jgi:hypothetical protein
MIHFYSNLYHPIAFLQPERWNMLCLIQFSSIYKYLRKPLDKTLTCLIRFISLSPIISPQIQLMAHGHVFVFPPFSRAMSANNLFNATLFSRMDSLLKGLAAFPVDCLNRFFPFEYAQSVVCEGRLTADVYDFIKY